MTATYCPEDNKLRLYVGRVPRDEYEQLRAQGWTSTPKQDCDFAATWTPNREDTAMNYAGEIEDEDQSPADRAADRAERFAGYREKRTDEARQLAGHYEAGPTEHGHQSQALAQRRAARHDRTGTRAVNQWEKAEYWQHRTAGVIDHALYASAPGVRMGRIKKLESEIRTRGDSGDRWTRHLRLRLDYEMQMLEAQGGRAAFVEMEPGGFIGTKQLQKVNKSPKTGRVVSVEVLAPTHGLDRWGNQDTSAPGFRAVLINIERLQADIYRAPTDEERAAFTAAKKAASKEKAKNGPKAPPLINPTNEDAERLQRIWNERARTYKGNDSYRAEYHKNSVQDQEVVYMTQENWSVRSKGSYAVCKTAFINKDGGEVFYRSIYGKENGEQCCKIRKTYGKGDYSGNARRVIVLTDKPQKPFPPEVWPADQEHPTPPANSQQELFEAIA